MRSGNEKFDHESPKSDGEQSGREQISRGSLNRDLQRWGEWKTKTPEFDSQRIKAEAKHLILSEAEPETSIDGFAKSVQRASSDGSTSRRYDLVAFLGTVAGILIAVGFFGLGKRLSERQPYQGTYANSTNMVARIPGRARLTRAEVAHARAVLSNYLQLFGSEFDAAFETVDRVDLVLAREDADMPMSSETALLRLCYASRSENGDWTTLWSCDVLARPDRSFEFVQLDES
ncbi:MAG: hypothetical protein AAGG44_00880, partial [Planctomycetota bacterium]